MHFHILVGTTSGNTEYLADALNQRLTELGHTATLHDQPTLAEVMAHREETGYWLLCVATHGAGEYAESIIDFMEALVSEKPNLQKIKAAIVAIGDSSYDTFCKAGDDGEALILELNASLIAPTLQIDMFNELDPEGTAILWLDQWISKLSE
ncbi:flavodoxin [Idiomarina sp. A28L]|uniref:flavodoxin domain-containing protein n=1 Tax=Idiomarina sp. A28L TaxID=1036674 RepID=UPI0002138D1E|nr:flavodoxin domain-containing protein [Idiomarina sp. A28L]EGN76065.1 flavodoxin [Idiomarina sp. A28L]